MAYSEQEINEWLSNIRLVAKQRGAEISHEQWLFYYDETNNIRNLIYKDDAISDERRLKSEFIVGGLVFTCDEARLKATEASRTLPRANGEIKSRAVLSNSPSLNRVLQRRETTAFIDILETEGTLVHFNSQNNFYMAISPIINSLIRIPRYSHLAHIHSDLKNQLDTFTGDKPKAFLDELRKYGYPTIEGDSARPFCDYILSVLDDGFSRNPSYLYSDAGRTALLLRSMIAGVRDTNEIVISPRRDQDTLIDGFLFNYMQSCAIFPNSYHTYDMECTISEQVGIKGNNYIFVDSKDCVPVQLSDVLVRLLAKIFDYLDGIDPRNLAAEKDKLCDQSMKNLRRLWAVLKSSMIAHPTLLNSFSTPTALVLRQFYLDQICEPDA